MSILPAFVRRPLIKSRVASARLARRFRLKEDGVAAVEFALIVPVMMLMMIGSIEMSEAVTMDRRVSQVAATTGDLVARFDGSITPADVTEISKIGSWLLDKNPAKFHKLRARTSLVTVECEPAGPACTVPNPVPVNYAGQRERWRCDFDTEVSAGAVTCVCMANNAGSNYTTPRERLVEFPGSPALVVTQVWYQYQPQFYDFFMKRAKPGAGGVYTLTEKLYHKPRGATIKMNANGSAISGPNTCNL